MSQDIIITIRTCLKGSSKYLEGKKRMKGRVLIARFRCGNETKGGQYWREDEEKRYRICHVAEENMNHIGSRNARRQRVKYKWKNS